MSPTDATSPRQKILIVDDAPENIRILIDLLQPDYLTVFARSGEKALELAKTRQPDLVLLDIMMPGMDGYEVCGILKSDPATRDIPVIFVTAMGETEDETKGLYLGAADYITKPIRPAVVKARVHNHLKLKAAMEKLKSLYSMALDANPMTGLPGNNSVAQRIETALENKEDACVIYADLDYFKAYNDAYGFAKGDGVIQFTALTFKAALKSVNARHTFIGHVGGDDFVLVVPAAAANSLALEIRRRFDAGIPAFYSPEDAAARCIEAVNRKGIRQTFPIMSISLAGVDLSRRGYKKYIQVNDACAETKKRAKSIPGSSFFMDRRKSDRRKPA